MINGGLQIDFKKSIIKKGNIVRLTLIPKYVGPVPSEPFLSLRIAIAE